MSVFNVRPRGAISAGPRNNYAATLRPEATDDAGQGYAPGSAWLNTATGLFWVCLSAAQGAAVWVPESPQDHPGYASGELYPTYDGQPGTGAVPSADTIFWTAWPIKGRLALASLSLRVSTAGSADSAVKMAVYANRNGRPFGPPLAAPTVGAATGAVATPSQSVSGVVLPPGPAWIASKFTGTTLPAVVGHGATSANDAAQMGRTSVPASTGFLTGRSTPDAYANPWPTMTGGEAFGVVSVAGVPVIWLGTV